MVRYPARRPRDARSSNVWAWDHGDRVRDAAHRAWKRSATSGTPTTCRSTSRSPTARVAQHLRARQGTRPDWRRRRAAPPRRRSALVRADRAVPPLAGRVDGMATETSTEAQIGRLAGRGEHRRLVPVELELDIRSAVPPWESGTLLEEAGSCSPTRKRAPDGRPALRAALPRDRHPARRRRRAPYRRRWPPHPAPGVRRLAAFRVTCGSPASSRAGGRSGTASTPADRRQADVQRGFPLRGRRRLDPPRVVDAPVATLGPRVRTRRSRSRPRTGDRPSWARPRRRPAW